MWGYLDEWVKACANSSRKDRALRFSQARKPEADYNSILVLDYDPAAIGCATITLLPWWLLIDTVSEGFKPCNFVSVMTL
jgi:hypothetical protein